MSDKSNDDKALATQGASGTLAIRTMDDLARVGNMLAKSGYFKDARDAAQAGVKVLAGLEMGFGAFASMTGIHLIEGKPSIGANLLAQAVKRSRRYNYRVTQHTAEVCEITFYEDGEEIGTSAFTMADARAAGVAGKHNWKAYPKAMLFARALSQGVRWHCPDVLGGAPAYTPEELGADVDEDGYVIDVEARPSKPAKPAPEPAPAEQDEPIDVQATPARENAIGEPIPEDDEPVDLPWEGDDQFTDEPEPPTEPLITGPQVRALQTRMSKLGFTNKAADRDALRAFFSQQTGREIKSSKELTKAEAHRVLDLTDDELADAVAAFNAERQMATEGEA